MSGVDESKGSDSNTEDVNLRKVMQKTRNTDIIKRKGEAHILACMKARKAGEWSFMFTDTDNEVTSYVSTHIDIADHIWTHIRNADFAHVCTIDWSGPLLTKLVNVCKKRCKAAAEKGEGFVIVKTDSRVDTKKLKAALTSFDKNLQVVNSKILDKSTILQLIWLYADSEEWKKVSASFADTIGLASIDDVVLSDDKGSA